MDFQQINSDALQFLDKIFLHIHKNNIEIKPHWDIDHLCYRVSTEKEYLEYKEWFLSFSDILIESLVGGRLISTFKLHKPIKYKIWLIDLIELPAPKMNKPTKLGFEHIEIVCDEPLELLQKKYAHLNLDTGGMKKNINAELEIIFGEENLKFHNQSLEEVIKIELSQK
jgi:predicted metalloenzyme YecM